MLIIIVYILQIQFYFCTPPQYNTTNYEPNAFPFDEKATKDRYKKTCASHGMRTCSINDINMHQRSGRHSCDPKWAYLPEFGGTVPVVLISAANKCNTGKNTSNGVYPRRTEDGPLGVLKVQNIFYCRPKTGKEPKPTDVEHCSGKGGDYQGHKAVTINGEPCQRWDYNSPNKINQKTSRQDSDFCRNPGGKKKKPWCYYRNKVGWDYCSVDCNQWGKHDKCKLLYGSGCTQSVKAGENKLLNHLSDNCKFIFNVKIEGTYCMAILSFKDQTVYINEETPISHELLDEYFMWSIFLKLDSIFLIDYSVDVILKPQNYMEYNIISGILHQYNICTIEQIDAQENFKDMSTTGIGLIQQNGKHWLYSYGFKEPSPTKGVWCCTNEFVYFSGKLVQKSKAEEYCSHSIRETSFDIRGKSFVYRHRRRMCTKVDVETHVKNFGYEYVNYCFVKTSPLPGDILLTNAIHYADVNHENRVCCCDEDCLPINFLCAKNEHCCSNKCSKGRCYDEGFPDIIDDNDWELEGFRLSYLLVLVGFIYCFGWIMRVCCPERRTSDRMVKNVAE